MRRCGYKRKDFLSYMPCGAAFLRGRRLDIQRFLSILYGPCRSMSTLALVRPKELKNP